MPPKPGAKGKPRPPGPVSGRGYAPPDDRPWRATSPAIIIVAGPAIVIVAGQSRRMFRHYGIKRESIACKAIRPATNLGMRPWPLLSARPNHGSKRRGCGKFPARWRPGNQGGFRRVRPRVDTVRIMSAARAPIRRPKDRWSADHQGGGVNTSKANGFLSSSEPRAAPNIDGDAGTLPPVDLDGCFGISASRRNRSSL